MGRDLTPKAKIERREGVKLFLKGEKSISSKNPFVKRPYPPGQHGPSKRPSKLSGYGQRLREKQKAKRMYRLMERAFHNYYVKAGKQAGNTSENLLKLLETRLDNVVYRLNFADSRDQAKQLVTHGSIWVNKKPVRIPSYQIKAGDIIEAKESSKKNKYWQELKTRIAKKETLGWLSLNAAELSGTVVCLPLKEDLSVPFDTQMIIEFYSR